VSTKAGLDVVGLPLVTGDGHQVGTVRDLVLDDGGRQVLGVMLERGWLRRRRQFVALDQVHAIRRDRVVAHGDRPEAAPPPHANGSLTGKLAVSRTGAALGGRQEKDRSRQSLSCHRRRAGRVRHVRLTTGTPARAARRRHQPASGRRPAAAPGAGAPPS
jgi:hypothetical protein